MLSTARSSANLAGLLAAAVATGPDHDALRHGDVTVSYRELDDATARVADLLRERGVEPGDRVGLMLPNAPQFAYAYYGVLRAGAVVVPINPGLSRREISHCLADAGARLVFAWHDVADFALDGATRAGAEPVLVRPGSFEERLDAAPAPVSAVAHRSPGDTAVILYTSGTTGDPKGAELTHANLARNAEVTVQALGMTPADVVLAALPLAQAFGQTCGLNASVLAGASLVLLARLDPRRVLARIVQDRVTILHGEPSIYAALLDHPRRLDRGASALRLCVSGESALAPDVSSGFEAAFGCPILEGYGLSEASPVACLNRPGPVPRPGSIGHPVDGVEMRILDPEDGLGEIAIRGHNVMKGYWNDPEATAAVIDADGWLSTGDIGRVDEHGRFYLLDRKQDVILRGGRLVYPREVERALGEHPAVREAAVIGRAHPELGEEVCAAVVLGDRTAADPSELAAFVRERVAAYKCPRHVWVVDELPKTPTGKVLKRDIEVPDQVLDRHAAS